MCLAVPMEIIEMSDELAIVEVAGVRRQVNVELVLEPKVGDFVIVHAGYAIEKLSADEAMETLDLLRQVAELDPSLTSPEVES